MGFAVNTNVSALNSYRNLNNTQNDISKSLEKLSTGLRINRAADDAAGLAISEGLRSQINGLNVASRNAQDGISVIQTAEGALTETHSILQRMRDLAVQAANGGSLNTEATANIQKEVDQLVAELDRIADTTQFNGTALLDGSYDGTFQIGANAGESINVALSTAMTAEGLGLRTGAAQFVITTADTAAAGDPLNGDSAIGLIDAAIASVSSERADLGAYQNRLEHTIKHINVAAENLSASESRIRDTDMAHEMANFTKNQIMSQAGTAMLAQANQINQGVLQLLG